MPKHPTGYDDSTLRRFPERIRTSATAVAPIFAGVETISAGSASNTVSTAAVQSGQMFRTALQIQSAAVLAPIAVHSIVDNTSFELGWADGAGVADVDAVVSWEIINRG